MHGLVLRGLLKFLCLFARRSRCAQRCGHLLTYRLAATTRTRGWVLVARAQSIAA